MREFVSSDVVGIVVMREFASSEVAGTVLTMGTVVAMGVGGVGGAVKGGAAIEAKSA